MVAYKTGDASVYLSSGNGIVGGGQHEHVRQMVFPYVKLGQELLSKTQKTNTTPLPDKDCVRFYFLTNQGTYFAKENMRNIENKTSDWLKLFEEANEVMNKLIVTAEKK